MNEVRNPDECFNLRCQADGTCTVQRAGEETAPRHTCATLVEAVTFAQTLKTGRRMQMTVYDPEGKVLLQSFA